MVSKKSVTVTAVALAALTLPTVALSGSASAQEHRADAFRIAKTLGTFRGPLQFAVGQNTYVADSIASTLTSLPSNAVIAKGGDPSTGGDLAGVGVYSPYGELAYTWSGGAHNITEFVLRKNGKQIYSTNLAVYEGQQNPDGGTTYGAVDPTDCQKAALRKAHIPVSYKGDTDSHPYATTYIGHGQWAVADAGGNDILRVDTVNHVVSTLALIPPSAFVITKAFADANSLPACTVGLVYNFEPVPTDVENGPHGYLYVSTLPGGPEGGPGVYPRGRIIKISPSGQQTVVGAQFNGATNIAVTPGGIVFVAELGRGVISAVVNHAPKVEMHLNGVVGLEWANDHLYASTAPGIFDGKSPGKVYLLDKTS